MFSLARSKAYSKQRRGFVYQFKFKQTLYVQQVLVAGSILIMHQF